MKKSIEGGLEVILAVHWDQNGAAGAWKAIPEEIESGVFRIDSRRYKAAEAA